MKNNTIGNSNSYRISNMDAKNTQRILTKNAAYQKFEVLKSNRNKRYKYQEFFVEGVRNINEAVKNNWKISSFLYAGNKPVSDWAKTMLGTVKTDCNYELTLDLMMELSGKEDTSELIAIVKMREDTFNQFQLTKQPLLALFDRPSNKGNLGTIIRSCDALGIEGLIITGHSVDLYDPDVIVSSMGSFFHVPVIRIAENQELFRFIGEMKKQYPEFHTIGTTAHKQKAIYDCDLRGPILFMVGNETDGLCNAFKEQCDILATIPMCEQGAASSFNVGCAATVLFYEAVRQRNKQ